ncbi:MAG: excinuclease ABC subunit UvrA [Ignavibacteriae bacterium]|nr:excinuclease ABC subunit UvrA [Ignavibacteria bacterium]MBI3365157.1 excinuclease ABC subunit UvrA [Ignavibacteriota bacterium]
MEQDKLIVKGARVHNLKNIDVEMPRDELIVITGLSGSGKSSLAFDTIYAEGQRRYVESLSAYARQFLGLMERPDVDNIEGLSPAISIEQKTVSHNPRSTVGTVTEIYDYLRLLFARVGIQHCFNCGRVVQKQSVDQIIDAVMAYPHGTKIQILAPVIRGRKGHYRELFEQILKDGFLRIRVDGEVQEIGKGTQVDRYKVHNIEIVVDRLAVRHDMRSRLADSVETALRMGSGLVIVNSLNERGSRTGKIRGKKDNTDQLFSRHLACLDCGISYDEPAPNSFSFNSPYGSCPTCHGLGETKEFDTRLIIPDDNRSVNQEGLAPLGKPRETWLWSQVHAVAARFEVDLDTPIKKLPKKVIDIFLYGGGDDKFEIQYRYQTGRIVTYRQRFNGLIETLKHYFDETSSEGIRQWVESFMNTTPCPACNGGRLRTESLAVRLNHAKTRESVNIHDVVQLSLRKAEAFFAGFAFTERQQEIAHQIVKEITQRLQFLLNVGLDYLTLDRPTRTLSGGEAQRIRLATQIGSQLVGVLYILDEPSIGLHQRDNLKLIDSLKELRDLGNTVIVVEHDKEMIQSADFVVDLGPGAGEHGGHVVTTGKPNQLKMKNEKVKNGNGFDGKSSTALYLIGKKRIEVPLRRRDGNGKRLSLLGASGNNLQSVDLHIPLAKFVVITGVSGSGKSSLISETLYRILARKFYKSKEVPLSYKSIEGLAHIDKVIDIDQSPIGRTPRSNPATYTGLFTFIRDLYTQLPEAKIRGYKAGRFSFNVKGGRCDECEGDGVRKIEMNFLPDVYVLCDVCKGKRYNRETLEIVYKGKSIADVLNMTVEEAVGFFSEIPRLQRKLRTLHDVGLGYIRLGQQATTLSGGEAQRVKLSTELSKVGTGQTLYILDEPTTGLHFEDIRMLLAVLNKLVDKGNTVIVIEHNLDVIKTADWVIDLGPEGGEEGGKIIAEGTPEEVAKVKVSYTGQFLKQELSLT